MSRVNSDNVDMDPEDYVGFNEFIGSSTTDTGCGKDTQLIYMIVGTLVVVTLIWVGMTMCKPKCETETVTTNTDTKTTTRNDNVKPPPVPPSRTRMVSLQPVAK
jgi:hypothetical protein